MNPPRFTLVADGPTDSDMLVPILEWLLKIHCPNIGIKVEYADPLRSRKVPKGLDHKIKYALLNYPCDCLFIHRDAEKEPPKNRRQEVRKAVDALGDEMPAAHVCVVPVRMSEAWLLFDEQAIRHASGNPNGQVSLEIPRPSAIESVPDPKRLLYELLTTASEPSRRRRKSFDPIRQSRRVAQLLDDFSPLRQLSAFRALEEDVRRIAEEKRWNRPR